MSVTLDNFEIQTGKSNYTRLTPGKHRLRILAEGISGWEWWVDTPEGGRKPTRIKTEESPPVEFADEVRKFLALPVWNYDQNRIQILELTQASIQKELKALGKDKDWGDLTKYDIEIERTGQDKNSTKYRVTPKPKSELPDEAQKAILEGLPVLDALYAGQDPFTYNPDAENIDEEELDKIFKEDK